MKISIITVNRNNNQGLMKTLQSVKMQSYKDYELIIVDGASSDQSIDTIKEYSENSPSTKYVSEKDTGIYNAMNKGINLSMGEYLIFMNSGDSFFDKDSLQNSVIYLNGMVDIVSGIAISDKYVMNPVTPDQLSLSFFLKSSMNHQSTFIKSSLMKKYYYNEKYKIVSDTEFFFKAMILGNCTYRDISVKVCYCEQEGVSRDIKKSLAERYMAIKALLPERMEDDIDFIIKYNNPILRKIGDILYRDFFRILYDKIVRRGGRI